MKHPDSITAIISGNTSISAEARRIGVNPAILHRELKKHPDYEAAKADGRIRRPGIATDRVTDVPADHPAVAAVRAGAGLADVCREHNLTPTALKRALLLSGEYLPAPAKRVSRPVAESELRAATLEVQRTLLAHQRALERLAELTLTP